MKKLAMILAIAFTMGLTASTVSASVKDDTKTAKTATCTDKEKKDCSTTEKKACCSSAKTTEAAPAPAKK